MAREPRAIQQCLCALLGLLGAAEAHGYARPVVLVGIAALQNLHRSLFTVARAAVGALFDIDGAVRTRVRHQRQPALNGLHRSGKAVVFLHHGQHLALGTSPLRADARNSDTSSVSPGMAPIRYLPGMKISCPSGCTGRAKPNLPASFTSVHSTAFPVFRSGTGVHALAHTTLFRSTSSSTAPGHFFVVAQLRLQLFQAARLLLQLFQYFCFDSHNMLLTPHT